MSPSLKSLTEQFATHGMVREILLRPKRGVAALRVDQAEAIVGRGLLGDRRSEKVSYTSKRDLTLIQHEHLSMLAKWTHRESIDAGILRRNLVIEGVNLLSLHSPFPDVVLRFQIGESAQIEITGPCDPCSNMEKALGQGAYNAMRGHGGVTARLVQSGVIRVGDVFTRV